MDRRSGYGQCPVDGQAAGGNRAASRYSIGDGVELERRTVLEYDGFNSPGLLLARFFFECEKPGNLFLLTGPSGSGKTTWCVNLVEQARQMGILAAGLVSPPVFENKQRTGIDLVDVESGTRARLANRRKLEKTTGSSRTGSPHISGVVTLDWQFNLDSLQKGNEIITRLSSRLVSQEAEHGKYLVILDELGPLELVHHQGWVAGVELISNRKYQAAVVVIRPGLLMHALELWPWAQSLKFTAAPGVPGAGAQL